MRQEGQEKPAGGRVILAGLGGFLVGSATVLFVLWLYRTPAAQHTASQPVVAAPERRGPATPPVSPSTPAPPAARTPVPSGDLARRELLVPVQGIGREQLADTFGDARGGGTRPHEALDIMAPRNTPVLAVEDGKIQKLFTSDQGGLTIYQFDPAETYAYYYAHLDRYADGLKEGQAVRKGQVIGYVGITGNASPDGPHLHFAIFRLTPEKQWWKGDPLNPFDALRGSRNDGELSR